MTPDEMLMEICPHGVEVSRGPCDKCRITELRRQVEKLTAERDKLSSDLKVVNAFLSKTDTGAALHDLQQLMNRLRIDSENYRAECGLCGTKNCDMLTDDYCASCKIDRLRSALTEASEAIHKIVESDGEDAGVIYPSDDSPVYFDETLNAHVYEHENFSPLGDSLVKLAKIIDAGCKEQPHDA